MLGDLISDVDVLEVYRRIRGRPYEVYIWVSRWSLRMRRWVLWRWARMHCKVLWWLCGMAEPDRNVSVELRFELLGLPALQNQLRLLKGKLFIRAGC